LREEEARFRTRQVEQVEADKRIQNEILQSEEDRREEEKFTRQQIRKNVETEFARLHERKHEEDVIRAEALKAAEELILQQKKHDEELRLEVAIATEVRVLAEKKAEAEWKAEQEAERKVEYAKIREEILAYLKAPAIAEAKQADYEHKIRQEAAEEAVGGTAKTDTLGQR